MSLLETNTFDAHASFLDVHRDDATLYGLGRTGPTYDLNEVAFSNLLHSDPAPGIACLGRRLCGERLCIR